MCSTTPFSQEAERNANSRSRHTDIRNRSCDKTFPFDFSFSLSLALLSRSLTLFHLYLYLALSVAQTLPLPLSPPLLSIFSSRFLSFFSHNHSLTLSDSLHLSPSLFLSRPLTHSIRITSYLFFSLSLLFPLSLCFCLFVPFSLSRLTGRPSRWRNSSPLAASRRQTLSHPAASFVAVICVSHPRWRPPADGVPARQASLRPCSRLAASSPRGPERRPPVAVRNRRPPGASIGFIHGGRPWGLVYDGHPPRPRLRHPIPPRPRAAPPAGVPRGRPVASFAAAVRAVSSATDSPRGKRPPRSCSRRAAPSPPRPIPLLQGAGAVSPRGKSATGVPGPSSGLVRGGRRSVRRRRHDCKDGSGTLNARASGTTSRLQTVSTGAEMAAVTTVVRQEEHKALTWQPMTWTIRYINRITAIGRYISARLAAPRSYPQYT